MARLNKRRDLPPRGGRVQHWLKRFGLGAFLFFLLKGIAWLVVLWFGLELAGC